MGFLIGLVTAYEFADRRRNDPIRDDCEADQVMALLESLDVFRLRSGCAKTLAGTTSQKATSRSPAARPER